MPGVWGVGGGAHRFWAFALLAMISADAAGCAEEAASGEAGHAWIAEPSCRSRSQRRIRRLSRREYLNVIGDLLGEDAATAAAPFLPAEATHSGFDNQDSALLVSPVFQEAVASVADHLSQTLDTDALAPCATPDKPLACLQTFAHDFARRAYGRPPASDELTRMMTAAQSGEDYAGAVRLIVEVVLQSPNTLYASELGDAAPGKPRVRLTPFEVASQLSLLLTAARPDDELLAAAERGALNTPAQLTAQAERLLATDRGHQQWHALIAGWLDMGPVADAPKDSAVFPEFTPELAAAMQAEFDHFIDSQLTGSLTDLLTHVSDEIPAELLPIYASDLQPDTDQPRLNPERRAGVLSLPGLLTYHSADVHSGPVERGLLVRRQLLCQTIPPPPDAVIQRIAAMPLDTNDATKTTRQKYEAHVNEDFCHSCHGQFDPIGFGMEEVDGLGRFRSTEHDLPVDSSGELLGTDVDGQFNGVAELSRKLAQSRMIQDCFVQHFYRFASSRPLVADERCLAADTAEQFAAEGGAIQRLFARFVAGYDFASRVEDRP